MTVSPHPRRTCCRHQASPQAAAASKGAERHVVVGDGVTYSATVESIPFFDPSKSRTHA